MKVAVTRRGRAFHYSLRLDPDDHEESRRESKDCPAPFMLVNREYRVSLPESFRDIHPDLHALAVWHTLRPVVASRLELPFAASPELARWLYEGHGVTLVNVSSRQAPRRAPETVVPALLFSGGMDSMAASLLMPRSTRHLFLDRIPHLRPGDGEDVLIDLAVARKACAAVAASGRAVHAAADDHEFLFSPYPMWHSDMSRLPALYLADSLGLSTLDAGEVFDAAFFGGYHAGASRWRMKRREGRPPRPGERRAPEGFWGAAGLRRANSICGLSEVVTTAVVGRSRYRGKSFSCYYPPAPGKESFCMRCDKCFKKLLLRAIADGQEVPEACFERFLSLPRLAAIFARPYFDWHHVWYYVFQKLRCRHWFARELQRQARQGPDLSVLEKWYPKAAQDMEPAYADAVRANIARCARTMTSAEMVRLEDLDVPPLHAPPLKDRPGPGRGPAVLVPAETKALFRLLQAKLLGARRPRWGGCRLEEVFLRPPEPSVWFRLRSPRGRDVVALLRRTAPDGPQPVLRLGALGICFPLEGRRPKALLGPMARAILAVLREARRELGRV
ncbi:MAG: DUF6395 domain-containing protein [Elusimicrobia bacterium]|nr:DUF6395 domain-containing protein [Elusimicrobiota bacterium]